MDPVHLVLALVLLLGVDQGPGRRELLQAGLQGDGEGVHTVGDVAGGQDGIVGPGLVPLTSRIESN